MFGYIFTICDSKDIIEYEMPIQVSTRLDGANLVPFDQGAVKEFYLKKMSSNNKAGIEFYKASCDIKKRISGFTDDGVAFNSFFIKKSFMCYELLGQDLFLLQSDIKTCKNFLRQYNQHRKLGNKIKPIQVNFDIVEKNVIINGCSAQTFNDTTIKAKQLYGNDIFNHSDYKEIKKSGRLTSFTIEYNYHNKKYLVLISSKGCVWVKNSSISITDAINITKEICKELLLQ